MTETNPETTLVEKLMALAREQKHDFFTEDEAVALQRFAKFLLALETLGSAGVIIRNILIWFGSMIGIWIAIKTGALEWLSTNLGK